MSNFIPKRVFIVPYRNRIQHKFFFTKQMSFILEDENDYEIYIVHQYDNRSFNRGAIKNIGFLAIKEKYPNDYKNITFIFNDVDTLPFHKIFDYKTNEGVVKHYYGFEYALGGIVVMKGNDFEKINGFPNFWGWGMEDTCLQKRCEKAGIFIDRSIFYPIGSPEILQLFDGVSRIICSRDVSRSKHDNGTDGINTIKNLMYSIDKTSSNPQDNRYIIENDKFHVVNVNLFTTPIRSDLNEYHTYDLRDDPSKIVNPDANKKTNNIVVRTTDWKEIESRPNFQDKNASYPPPPQIFSQQYAQYIDVKPRASKSANIGMGGVRR